MRRRHSAAMAVTFACTTPSSSSAVRGVRWKWGRGGGAGVGVGLGGDLDGGQVRIREEEEVLKEEEEVLKEEEEEELKEEEEEVLKELFWRRRC